MTVKYEWQGSLGIYRVRRANRLTYTGTYFKRFGSTMNPQTTGIMEEIIEEIINNGDIKMSSSLYRTSSILVGSGTLIFVIGLYLSLLFQNQTAKIVGLIMLALGAFGMIYGYSRCSGKEGYSRLPMKYKVASYFESNKSRWMEKLTGTGYTFSYLIDDKAFDLNPGNANFFDNQIQTYYCPKIDIVFSNGKPIIEEGKEYPEVRDGEFGLRNALVGNED